jgi:hypothetical protein
MYLEAPKVHNPHTQMKTFSHVASAVAEHYTPCKSCLHTYIKSDMHSTPQFQCLRDTCNLLQCCKGSRTKKQLEKRILFLYNYQIDTLLLWKC